MITPSPPVPTAPSERRALWARGIGRAALLAVTSVTAFGSFACGESDSVGPAESDRTPIQQTTSSQPTDSEPLDTSNDTSNDTASDTSDGTAQSTSATDADTTASSADEPTTDVDWTALDLVLVPLAEFSEPLSVTSRPGSSDLYVGERRGTVEVIQRESEDLAGDAVVADEHFLDISELVTVNGERGLLDVVFSPDGQQFFVSYTDGSGDLVIAAYAVDADRADPDSRREIIRIAQPAANHNGGSATFGPDGFLYIGVGDGGGADDPDGNGQNPETLLGSVLRIDPFDTASDTYSVPSDNPFANGGGRPEIWAFGLRNPWRISFDRNNGDLWIADVGQNAWEEINRLRQAAGGGAGANLGWNALEGDQPFEGVAPDDHELPIFSYGHESGRCSVTGGYVYRGSAIPALDGVYVFADFCTGEIFGLHPSDNGPVVQPLSIESAAGRVASFGQSGAGELLVLERSTDAGPGAVSLIVTAAAADR